jgi:ubiquinone/menaquinone biosynthesis C-methylase UbiE
MTSQRDSFNSDTTSTQPEAATLTLPPAQTMYQLATGHYVSRALFVAAKLGIADLLADGPRHYEDIAKSTGTHAPSLKRMMRLLASSGVFSEHDDGNFSLTSLGECLRTSTAGSSRAMVMHYSGPRMQENWKDLEYCVRSGEFAARRRGVTNIFTDPLRTPEEAAVFDVAMSELTRLTATAVALAYDFTPYRLVVDVGGGNGTLMIGILKANPSLRGILVDQPAAIERAKKQIEASGLAGRCEAVASDFFNEVPRGGDAYILKHVIHDWDDQQSVSILKNCHRAMDAGGKLLIIEGVYSPRIDQSPEGVAAARNDLNMLVSTGGRQRSEAEFSDLYNAAGFRLTRVVPTVTRINVVEGVRL